MGTLMYVPIGLENSPYRGLCGPNLMIEVGRSYFDQMQQFTFQRSLYSRVIHLGG